MDRSEVIEDAKAALAGWLPISTAPKDGTRVLITVAGTAVPFVCIGRWWGGEKWSVDGFALGRWTDEILNWMPMPPPSA